jgi:hypothetical protein
VAVNPSAGLGAISLNRCAEGSSLVGALAIFGTRRPLKNSKNPNTKKGIAKDAGPGCFDIRPSDKNPNSENGLDSLFPIYYIASGKRTMQETDL